ncbi:ribonuclease HII [Actinomyces sp. B33]|uniref:ribonuclease HII n=1 Tax=Actinomyces sp. B33 TaxID=2942131 RepID=UPI0023405712|nr:ribonuclease HII [Actinomyces sp. B33]MDC4232955.1 ribonuclease HII [Actinomyces sp. B33]
MTTASRRDELLLARDWGIVAGMDEVGRGALAGPVAVGVALVDGTCADPPEGLTDSKALTARARARIEPRVRAWVLDCAVGWASPGEIDRWGIIAALRTAGLRALAEVVGRGRTPGGVLLDGSHDWLSPPEDLLAGPRGGPEAPVLSPFDVVTRVKADASCAVVAAASVIAKEARDAHMRALEDPGYDWAHNVGYASPAHIAGLAGLGACREHRRSWRLPGVTGHAGARGAQPGRKKG